MPRISDDNPRFRTKERICSDVAEVLNSQTLHYGTQQAVLNEVVWVWTEFDGKYKGCKYWSEAAWLHQHDEKLLVHEHAVPKSLVIKLLRELPKPVTAGKVSTLLETYCKAAILTREEDRELNKRNLRSSMPEGWDKLDPWARYKAAGIILRAHNE